MEAEEVAQNYFKHLQRAQLLMEVSRWREALHEYNQHLTNYPDDYPALCNTALCYLELKEYQRALDATKRAIEAAPEEEWAYRLRSNIFTQNGEPKRALDEAKVCIEKEPASPLTIQCLFWAQAGYGSLDEAEVTLKALIEVMPGGSDSHEAAGYLALKQKKNLEAEKHYLEALKLDPESTNALNNLGVVYLNLAQAGKGRHYQKKSVEMFERAVKVQPTFKLAQKNISTASNAIKIGAPAGLIFVGWLVLRLLGSMATTGSYLGGGDRNGSGIPPNDGLAMLNPATSNYLVTAANLYFLILLISTVVTAFCCLIPRYRDAVVYELAHLRGWLIPFLLFGGVFAFFIISFRLTSTSVDTTPPFSALAFTITIIMMVFTGINVVKHWSGPRT